MSEHPVTQYSLDVVREIEMAGPLVRGACKRHLDDLEHGHLRGIRFDEDRADHALDFFPTILRLNGGEFEGVPFDLHCSQKFIVGSLFGWLNDEDLRRFRVGYIEVGKGNGKAVSGNTLIPTPNGWKMMCDIVVGDSVYDDSGGKCDVLAATGLMNGRPCWRIGFSDGSSIVADSEHLWRVQSFPGYVIQTTEQLTNSAGPHFVDETRWITRFERIDSVPVKCISVSGTQMYLAGPTAIPTHNSPLLAGIGLYGIIGDREPRAEVYSAAPLALDTPVPTAKGWKTQGTLEIGDEVFDENGDVCKVTHVFPIKYGKCCYEVEFDDDTTIVADSDHLWQTEDTRGQRPGMYEKSIKSTRDIASTIYANFGCKRLRHRIDIAKPLNLEEVDLPLDPEVLGIWLGDGRRKYGSICYHKDDYQILEPIFRAGFDVTHMKPQGDVRYCTLVGFKAKLRELNLLDNKHIPGIYLRSSFEQRRRLLCGLMSTDGTCLKNGECVFTNREYDLASGVHELATSLGLRAHFSTKYVTGKPHYKVSFRAPKSLRVFGLDRKFCRQVDSLSSRIKARYIKKVTAVKSVPVRCVEVSSKNSLYLVSHSFIASHNSKKEQAMIMFRDAVSMVDQSPALASRFLKSGRNDKVWNLFDPVTNSFFRPISAEQGQSGPRPHIGLIDELHEHKSPVVMNMMSAGRKSRRQPLVLAITNSGSDQTSVCWEYHAKAAAVCTKGDIDDTFFAYVCALSDGEDPFLDERCWKKANPLLGVTVKEQYLRDEVVAGRSMPSKESSVRRLNFCQWTQSDNPLIAGHIWDQAGGGGAPDLSTFDLSIFAGAECIVGLDLSAVADLTAAVFVVRKDGVYFWWPEFWIPEGVLAKKVKDDKVPYDTWLRKKHIRVTPGNSISLDFVAKDLRNIVSEHKLNVVEWAYDRWKIEDFKAACLRVGFDIEGELVEFGQGFMSMGPAVDSLEKSLSDDKIRHNKNPCLRWNAANAVVDTDPAGSRKFTKSKTKTKRIDGMVAGTMAHHRMTLRPEAAPTYTIRWAD